MRGAFCLIQRSGMLRLFSLATYSSDEVQKAIHVLTIPHPHMVNVHISVQTKALFQSNERLTQNHRRIVSYRL